jgi:hypothetical protein
MTRKPLAERLYILGLIFGIPDATRVRAHRLA